MVLRRRAGEIVRASWRLYRARAPAFAAIGTLSIPIALVGLVVTALLARLPWFEPAPDVSDEANRVLIAGAVSAVLWPLTILLVSAAVAELLESGATRPWRALAAVRHRAWDLARSFFPMVVLIVLLSLTVVGAPVAVWLAVRMQLLAPTVMLEHTAGWTAVRRSGRLVRGRWLHTAVVTALIWLVVGATGITLGLVLLIAVPGLPLWSVSAVALLCQVALVPLGGIALTLLYGDARAERDGS